MDQRGYFENKRRIKTMMRKYKIEEPKQRTEAEILENLRLYPNQILEIENPSIDFLKRAFKINSYVITLIRNKTEKLYKIAIEEDPSALRYIDNPSFELCVQAVEKEPYTLMYVNIPVKKIEILKELGLPTDEYITREQYRKLCKMAICKDKNAIDYVNEEYIKI